MTDPKRWVHDPLADHTPEQRVLSAGLELDVPQGLEDRMWTAFSGAIGDGAALPDASAPTIETLTSTPTWTAIVLKSLGIGAVVGALGVGALELLTHSSESTTLSNPKPTAAVKTSRNPTNVPAATSGPAPLETDGPAAANSVVRRPTATRESPVAEPRGIPIETPELRAPDLPIGSTAFPPPSRDASAPPPREARENALRAEALELARAENLLKGGRAAEAEALLENSSRRFPAGMLSQERELLMIDALGRLGKSALAQKRARAFLERSPNSPLAPKIRRLGGIE